jgi:hypothetical protein
MVASNVLLSIRLNNQVSQTILVPTLCTRLEVSADKVSEEYLRLRASEVVSLLFSLNAENSEGIGQLLLKQVDNPAKKEFRKQLQVLSNDIKERGYYYHFTDLQGYTINAAKLSVKIKGYLETYFNDKKINRLYKEYEVTFVNNGGVVLLNSFREVSDA